MFLKADKALGTFIFLLNPKLKRNLIILWKCNSHLQYYKINLSFSIKLQEINLYLCEKYKSQREARDPNRTECEARRSNISKRKARRSNISERGALRSNLAPEARSNLRSRRAMWTLGPKNGMIFFMNVLDVYLWTSMFIYTMYIYMCSRMSKWI